MIDGRLLDTDMRWEDYVREMHIKDPFQESRIDRVIKQVGRKWITEPADEERRRYWDEQKDNYLRLEHTFRLWDFHFWMEWERFQRFLESESLADVSIYLPCDTMERQCSMTCPHFGKENCPRRFEELKSPIEGVEERWEYHDDYYGW